MVYELSWKRAQTLDKDTFKMFSEDCKAVCDMSNIEIVNGAGDEHTSPEFSEDRILFNGIFGEYQSESFGIRQSMNTFEPDEYGLTYEFSKISNHPYGFVAIACLIIAKYHFRDDFFVYGQGPTEEWKKGFELAIPALGSNPKEIIEIIFNKPPEDLKTAYKNKITEEKRKANEGNPARLSIDTKDVAKLVRADLKKHFPGQKFSVTIDRYSGGSSIDVRWINGPTREKVESIVGHYKAGAFDGMTDCYEYGDSPYCNKYIFCQRDYDHTLYLSEVKRIAKDWGVTLPEDLQYNQVSDVLWIEGHKIGTDLQHFVCEEIAQTDY